MTPKQEVKTLEEKAQDHVGGFFMFLAWILGGICVCLWVLSLGMNLQMLRLDMEWTSSEDSDSIQLSS